MGRDAGYNHVRGSFTVTPIAGMKITGITVKYSDSTYGEYDTNHDPSVTVSAGNYTRSGNTGTWTGSSTQAVTFTNGYRLYWGSAYYPRITSIQVTYEPI
jgi:hypothetical protein